MVRRYTKDLRPRFRDFHKRFNYAYGMNDPVFVSERRLDGGYGRERFDHSIADFHSRKVTEIATPSDCLGWGIDRVGFGVGMISISLIGGLADLSRLHGIRFCRIMLSILAAGMRIGRTWLFWTVTWNMGVCEIGLCLFLQFGIVGIITIKCRWNFSNSSMRITGRLFTARTILWIFERQWAALRDKPEQRPSGCFSHHQRATVGRFVFESPC